MVIPLSEAEQASFLAQYGDRIQDVVSTGFQRIERTLNRILFLQEAADVLEGVAVRFQLKKSYTADEIGHFRAFVLIQLRAITHDIVTIWFGSSDKSRRFSRDINDAERRNDPEGIAHGISGGQWERHVKLPTPNNAKDQEKNGSISQSADAKKNGEEADKYVQVGSSSSIGVDPVSVVVARYSHDDPLVRFRPRLQLRDLNDCMFMPVLNRSLADKLHSVQVFANGYKLSDIRPSDFLVDYSPFTAELSGSFTDKELADPWVRIRPSALASALSPHVYVNHSEEDVRV